MGYEKKSQILDEAVQKNYKKNSQPSISDLKIGRFHLKCTEQTREYSLTISSLYKNYNLIQLEGNGSLQILQFQPERK